MSWASESMNDYSASRPRSAPDSPSVATPSPNGTFTRLTSSVTSCSSDVSGPGRVATKAGSNSSMNFKKKRFKFHVGFSVDELTSVPFVGGILFCKVRLLSGGSFKAQSTREEISENVVKWQHRFEFPLKMNAHASTGVLESCLCRVSVRKELKGGKAVEKLGYVDIDLAHLAGQGQVSRRFLLEGYSSKHRVTNCMLQVSAEMRLLSGDPCFKAPSGWGEKNGFIKYIDDRITERVSEDSAFTLASPDGLDGEECSTDMSVDTRSRESSLTSQNSSKVYRDSASLASSGGVLSEQAARSLERRRRLEEAVKEQCRVSSTRPDPESVVSEVLQETSIQIGSTGGGLQLYMDVRNGTAFLGGAELDSSDYRPVVVKPDR